MKNKVYSFVSFGLAIAMLALGIILSPVRAMAQRATLGKVDIPFSFQIGSSVLPAGNYLVMQEVSNTITLLDRKTGHWAFVPALHVDSAHPGKTGAMEFARYGDQYFLHRLDVPNSSLAYKCWPNKKEAALARGMKTQTGTEVAVNTTLVLAP